MGNDSSDLDAGEEEALRRWGADWSPRAGLSGRTLDALRARGLLRRDSETRSRTWTKVAWVAAAGVAFVLGFGLGGIRSPTVPTPVAPQSKVLEAPMLEGDQFVLLLFQSEEYRPAPTPDARRDRVREYGAWARETAKSGRSVTGEKLAADGKWCLMRDGQIEVRDPAADSLRGTLAGYFVIGASSYDEAVDVARGCPHLRYGGTVEVRRIVST